jgi:hypothetical protein
MNQLESKTGDRLGTAERRGLCFTATRCRSPYAENLKPDNITQ